jgi:hypothetical protein
MGANAIIGPDEAIAFVASSASTGDLFVVSTISTSLFPALNKHRIKPLYTKVDPLLYQSWYLEC